MRKHGAYLTAAALEKVAELQPKANYCDQILQGDELLTATFIAKKNVRET